MDYTDQLAEARIILARCRPQLPTPREGLAWLREQQRVAGEFRELDAADLAAVVEEVYGEG